MKTVTMADWKATRFQKKLIKKVLKSGRLTYGPVTRQLEEEFAAIHGRKYALFTNSGTSALKIVLHAFKDKYGWKDGDEVIIPSTTFVATMNVALMNNLKPVLVDVNDYANIDHKQIEAAITKKTKAIIPVHLLGLPADMPKIMKIAKKHKLKVIEDSCETMFVNDCGGKPVGSRGDAACFSSYLAHLMVTGVGGFITTNDKEMATIMRSMMFHGRDESYLNIDDNNKSGKDFTEMVKKRFFFDRHGYSDRATELEAALGVGDLRNWREMIKKRQDNARYLYKALAHPSISFPFKEEDIDNHAFMFFPMFTRNRDDLIQHLESSGIHTRTMMPLTNQPVVRRALKDRWLENKFPKSKLVNKKGLLLGCHQYLTKKDLDHIVNTIKEFYND